MSTELSHHATNTRPKSLTQFRNWALTILFCLVGFATGCSSLDREAILVLEDLAAGPAPSRLKKQTLQPERRGVAYRIDGRGYQGDLYLPTVPARAKMVLVPGVAARGKEDPRLMAFAETLARAQILVLVPDLPRLRALKVGVQDVQAVEDAFAHLIANQELAPQTPAGLGAFSYAAGPTILAARRPGIRQEVDFLLAVGGYHDLTQVLAYFTTGYFFHDGEWRYLAPNRYGKWVFVISNLERLSDPADREVFRQMAERRMAQTSRAITPRVADLSPEGQALLALLDNTDPKRTGNLVAGLPNSIAADIRALDLANKDLDLLQAHLILVHGRDDNIIPYSQSIGLAKRLPPDQVDLFIVEGLFHVDLDPGVLDGWRLWRAIRTLLKRRKPLS